MYNSRRKDQAANVISSIDPDKNQCLKIKKTEMYIKTNCQICCDDVGSLFDNLHKSCKTVVKKVLNVSDVKL